MFSLNFLKDEIGSLKRKREETKEAVPKKYARNNELERQKEEEYIKEREEKHRRQLEKEAERLREIKERLAKEQEAKEETLPPRPVEEVKKRLKARQQPITLFGETDDYRLDRLRELEIRNPLDYNAIETQPSFTGSEYLRRLAEEEYDEDIEVQKRKNEELEDPDFKVEAREPECPEEEILFFFRSVINDMRIKLERRAEAERKTAKGRQDTAMFGQTKEYLRPFFQKLKSRNAPRTIVEKMREVVVFLKEKDFLKANDAYYRMAIGNSPWPIGVTCVGIHERSAREKIATDQTAHILNDDAQRKYISSVKRLMTFWQDQHPQLPSRTVS